MAFYIGDNDGETYVTLQEEEYTIPKSSNQDEEDDSQGKSRETTITPILLSHAHRER